jgi:hypothetical protein
MRERRAGGGAIPPTWIWTLGRANCAVAPWLNDGRPGSASPQRTANSRFWFGLPGPLRNLSARAGAPICFPS